MSTKFKERWKPIKNFENLYKVSSIGRVFSLPKKSNNNLKGRYLRPGFTTKKYLQVQLVKDGKSYACKVHRLVAFAFLKRIDGKDIVNHKNAVKTDNKVENLEWCTPMENTIHARKNGLLKWTKKSRKSASIRRTGIVAYWNNKKVLQLSLEGKTIKEFVSLGEAALKTKTSLSSISACVHGRYKTANGYKWILSDNGYEITKK